jgi:Uma2 family endonuclease
MKHENKPKNARNYSIGDLPRPSDDHQHVMRELFREIERETDGYHLTEVPVIPKKDDIGIPDIVVYEESVDRKAGKPPLVIIEITNKAGFKADCEKVVNLIQQFPFDEETGVGIAEGFVYDYDNKRWAKFTPDGQDTESPNYSDFLGIEFESHSFKDDV